MANLSKTSLANLRFVSIVISIPDATDAIESLLELELKASKHEGEGSKKKKVFEVIELSRTYAWSLQSETPAVKAGP